MIELIYKVLAVVRITSSTAKSITKNLDIDLEKVLNFIIKLKK